MQKKLHKHLYTYKEVIIYSFNVGVEQNRQYISHPVFPTFISQRLHSMSYLCFCKSSKL